MPAQKSAKSVQPPTSSTLATKKVSTVSASKLPVIKSKALQLKEAADALLAAGTAVKKKPGRPAKAATTEPTAAATTGAKRGPKPKAGASAPADDMDMSDIEADLVGEPEATTAGATGEKVKPDRKSVV